MAFQIEPGGQVAEQVMFIWIFGTGNAGMPMSSMERRRCTAFTLKAPYENYVRLLKGIGSRCRRC
jgi:hypothetical protein